jgi:uncharacterized membrane protein YphA (DoxX/SURF4 family)
LAADAKQQWGNNQMADTAGVTRTGLNWWNISLWVAQILLVVGFGSAGLMKLTQPVSALAAMGMGFVTVTPEWLVRFIGIAEVAGALGMVLPALTRILPVLTPLSALGFVVIQVLAIGLHASRGETAMTLPANLILLALALFVLWGRWTKAPISPR